MKDVKWTSDTETIQPSDPIVSVRFLGSGRVALPCRKLESERLGISDFTNHSSWSEASPGLDLGIHIIICG